MRDKLAAKSLVCTFLGYAQQRKAYQLIYWPSHCFLESRNVVFDEGGATSLYERVVLKANNARELPAHLPPPHTSTSTSTSTSLPSLTPSTQSPLLSTAPSTQPSAPTPTSPPSPNVLSRPKCTTRAPLRDDDDHYSVSSYQKVAHASIAWTGMADDPRTYAQAISRPDADRWDAACEEELNTFQRMGVYEFVPQPRD